MCYRGAFSPAYEILPHHKSIYVTTAKSGHLVKDPAETQWGESQPTTDSIITEEVCCSAEHHDTAALFLSKCVPQPDPENTLALWKGCLPLTACKKLKKGLEETRSQETKCTMWMRPYWPEQRAVDPWWMSHPGPGSWETDKPWLALQSFPKSKLFQNKVGEVSP
jgi:hypothetical protein